MFVKLPREVNGKELIEAIQRAAKDIEPDNFSVSLNKEEQYEPGSLKIGIRSAQVSISKLREETERTGFLWLKKKIIKEPGRPTFLFPELFPDKKYSELDVEMIAGVWRWGTIYLTSDNGLNEALPIFEKLVASIYKALEQN